MADHNERWLLTRLITLCRDEELTLRAVAGQVRDPAARALILDLAGRRSQFATDLQPHARRLGGFDLSEGTARGGLHRRWLALRHALLRADDDMMLREVLAEEDQAAAVYDDTLMEMLPPASRDVIEAQRAELDAAHQRVMGALRH